MDQLIEQSAALLEAHPEWVVAVAALAGFGESLIVIGAFVPGTTLLVIIGGLTASGLIDPLPAAFAAIAGATAGDTVTYYLGRIASGPLSRWRPLRRHRRSIAAARLFFRRYGVWSVLIGRFFGPLRATVPFVAGAAAMRAVPFQFANAASALLWAPLAMAPGWLAAQGVAQIGGLDPAIWLLVFAGLTLVLTVIPVVALRWFMRPRRATAAAHPPRRRTT